MEAFETLTDQRRRQARAVTATVVAAMAAGAVLCTLGCGNQATPAPSAHHEVPRTHGQLTAWPPSQSPGLEPPTYVEPYAAWQAGPADDITPLPVAYNESDQSPHQVTTAKLYRLPAPAEFDGPEFEIDQLEVEPLAASNPLEPTPADEPSEPKPADNLVSVLKNVKVASKPIFYAPAADAVIPPPEAGWIEMPPAKEGDFAKAVPELEELELVEPTLAEPVVETPAVETTAEAIPEYEAPEPDNVVAAKEAEPSYQTALFPQQWTKPARNTIEEAPATEWHANLEPAIEDNSIDEFLLDTPAVSEISRLTIEDVRSGFTLGKSGALYAARAEFVGVLRKIAIAKDAAELTDRHSVALANGLRAIEEASQFVPNGDAVEIDLDVPAIAASHRTPVLNSGRVRCSLPQEAIAHYHRYAAQQLTLATRGEQAGSMALFGLGKTYARLSVIEDDPLSRPRSLTMYRAAIAAHDGNHLAANELGVGLAQAGHYPQALVALQKAVARGAKSTVYQNLAMVHQKLGQPRLAQSATQRATQMASHERAAGEFSKAMGVQWMNPQEFASTSSSNRPAGTGVANTTPPPQIASRPAPPAPAKGIRFPWQSAPKQPQQSVRPMIPLNSQTSPVKSQTIVR